MSLNLSFFKGSFFARALAAECVMLLGCGLMALAQSDPCEGTWYLTNGSNYYLCPAAGYHQGNVDQPYITTFQTAQDKNSVWTIVPVDVNGDTYYRIIHNATGKYITANDAVSGYNTAYVRLHLEAFDTPTDATLFIIVTHTNNKVGIRSKDYDDAANNHYWLDISGGNKGNLWQDDGQGQLGFWYDNPISDNRAAPWTFQAATPVCATPVITFDEAASNFTISYPGDGTGVSIHYTTDGSEPTASSSTYSTAITASDVSVKLRAIAVKSGYADSYEAMVYGTNYSATPHLFKTSDYIIVDGVNTYYDFSYYLISPVDDGDANDGRNYLTTSNVPNERMQWYLKPATAANGVQYHYLVNAQTGKYIYFTGTKLEQGSIFVVKDRNEAGLEDDRFMFRIWERTVDGFNYFNFSPKRYSDYPPNHNKGNFLCKQNSADHNNPTGIYRDDNSYGRTRWQMVSVPANPKSLSALPPEMVSDASNSVYFKLRNATQDDNGNDYFVYPPSTAAYATSSSSGSNPEWYIEPANDDDTWNSYYHIRNAQTGHYLYFDSETRYSNNDNKFLTSDGITSGSEDKYKFLVLRTARTSASGSYHIVPKAIRNNNNQANIALSRENKTSAKLRSSNSRDNNNACWYLDPATFKCAAPTFHYSSGQLTISTTTKDAVIYYATDSSEPTISEASRYSGPVTLSGSVTVTAIAVRNANLSDKSDASTFEMLNVSSGDEITNMNGYYTLAENFIPSATSIGTAEMPFRGTLDGQFNTFTLTHPLFAYVEDATIRNVVLDNVSITSGNTEGNTGAIACSATGDTRIYNCGILATNSTVVTNGGYTYISANSSTVSGSNYVGGLVGLLDGTSRVINCFSYADITGGGTVGGIVGYNNVATTWDNLKTMVMNCMFYGDINVSATTNRAPVYNGLIITNRSDQKGVSNYNFCRAEASCVTNRKITTSNCALLAETRFLQRFEFFRHLLNGHRELAAWWITGDVADTSLVAKWVLEPSQIGTARPYPILKSWGKYPSVVNYDAASAQEGQTSNQGCRLGTLTVKIRMGNGGEQFDAPSGATLRQPSYSTTGIVLNITDKDPDHFNFNYAKVQLPYYNDVGTGNYTGNRVVTGWKIVEVTGGTKGTFTTGEDAPAYNFADRGTWAKDFYGEGGSNRIFNQGAYWDVPKDVTAITIEPYWAKAAYCADEYRDIVYNTDMTAASSSANVGGGRWFTNGSGVTISGQNQTVYNTIGNAVAALSPNGDHSVYDYAVVLVGNYHQYNVVEGGKKPYTIMSADFNGDNEPDYSFIFRFNGRTKFHPVRYDFLNFIGLGMAQKTTGGTGSYNFGIMHSKYWFEVTNTALFRVTQFEYDCSDKVKAPLIVQGGVIEQWVSGQSNGYTNNTQYFHVGGNVWFKEFHRGTHQDQTYKSKHPPISVTGGDYDEFYLTGLYRGDVTNYDDDAECYINGGHFGIMAGTGQEGIGISANKGNITWQIDNADIGEFYGGGINAAKPAIGNITTYISNSRVVQFCGGPKFGDMSSGKTVTTTATDCTFGTYFGAGYGGNSYSRRAPKNYSNIVNIDWNKWIKGEQDAGDGFSGFKQEYSSTYGGVATQFKYQFLPYSDNGKNVERIFIEYVKFSLATCHTVSSTLTRCTVTGNFYGGGNLGKVDGTVTSTLTDCTLQRNAFGAGFSATLPTVEVDSAAFRLEPLYYTDFGTFRTGVWGATTTYSWQHANTVNSTSTAIDLGQHILFTTENLETLGTVGDAEITLDGNTTVAGDVFGGGDQSAVIVQGNSTGSSKVMLKGGTNVTGNVYGGGNRGAVGGSSSVVVQD